MNAALSCKRFRCASFGEFEHVVFKIYHVPTCHSAIPNPEFWSTESFWRKQGFLLFGVPFKDVHVFSSDSLEKLISHSYLRDSDKHINRVYSHPHESK